jgi:hypothetical protein
MVEVNVGKVTMQEHADETSEDDGTRANDQSIQDGPKHRDALYTSRRFRSC